MLAQGSHSENAAGTDGRAGPSEDCKVAWGTVNLPDISSVACALGQFQKPNPVRHRWPCDTRHPAPMWEQHPTQLEVVQGLGLFVTPFLRRNCVRFSFYLGS